MNKKKGWNRFSVARRYHRKCMIRRCIKATLSIVGVAIIIALTLTNIKVSAKNNYSKMGVVVGITTETISVKDINGNIWEINCEPEDIYIYDLISLIMDTNGTDIIYDDTIVSWQYDGYISQGEYQLNWR